MHRLRLTRALILVALTAALPAIASATPLRNGIILEGFVRGPAATLHKVRAVSRHTQGNHAEDDAPGYYRYPARGDKSGYPGGNEFNPTAPFGGQAAVTARPGTAAYDEQMNQRRYFCEAASNRC